MPTLEYAPGTRPSFRPTPRPSPSPLPTLRPTLTQSADSQPSARPTPRPSPSPMPTPEGTVGSGPSDQPTPRPSPSPLPTSDRMPGAPSPSPRASPAPTGAPFTPPPPPPSSLSSSSSLDTVRTGLLYVSVALSILGTSVVLVDALLNPAVWARPARRILVWLCVADFMTAVVYLLPGHSSDGACVSQVASAVAAAIARRCRRHRIGAIVAFCAHNLKTSLIRPFIDLGNRPSWASTFQWHPSCGPTASRCTYTSSSPPSIHGGLFSATASVSLGPFTSCAGKWPSLLPLLPPPLTAARKTPPPLPGRFPRPVPWPCTRRATPGAMTTRRRRDGAGLSQLRTMPGSTTTRTTT